MTIINISAAKALEVIPFQSTEVTRFYLNGFAVESNPKGGVTLVATDGLTLLASHDPTGATDGESTIVFLSKSTQALIKNAIKSNTNKDTPVYLTIDTKARSLTCRALYAENEFGPIIASTMSPDLIVEGTFPEWRRVIPREPAIPFSHLAVNPGLVARFSTLGKFIMLKTSDAEGRAPFRVYVHGRDDLFGAVMPGRRNDVNDFPDWI